MYFVATPANRGRAINGWWLRWIGWTINRRPTIRQFSNLNWRKVDFQKCAAVMPECASSRHSCERFRVIFRRFSKNRVIRPHFAKWKFSHDNNSVELWLSQCDEDQRWRVTSVWIGPQFSWDSYQNRINIHLRGGCVEMCQPQRSDLNHNSPRRLFNSIWSRNCLRQKWFVWHLH